MTSAILSFLFLFTATTAAPPQHVDKEVALDKEFELRFNEEAMIKQEGLRIMLESVVEDSRCPTGATCVWAGNAKIEVFIKHAWKRRSYRMKLNTSIEPKQDKFIHKYDVKLVSLSPYPKKDVKIKKSDYVATLIVSRR